MVQALRGTIHQASNQSIHQEINQSIHKRKQSTVNCVDAPKGLLRVCLLAAIYFLFFIKLVHSFAYNAWPTGNLNVTTKNALDFPGFF